MIRLFPLSSPAHFRLVTHWLQQTENSQWLDFGHGSQPVTQALLHIMAQRPSNFLRLYSSPDDEDTPIGICGLHNVDRHFGTATLWGVAGDKSFRRRGLAQIAALEFLTVAFRELSLSAINTWVVEHNTSRRSVDRLGFRYAGRLRQCHRMDGIAYDRLLYDLLAEEHLNRIEGRFDRSRRREAASSVTLLDGGAEATDALQG